MQKAGRGFATETASKPLIFGLTIAIVVGIVAPLILPHATQPSMIYHGILHIANMTIVVFLSILSLLAFQRVGGVRMLLMTLAFMTLGTVELIYLLSATGAIVMPLTIPEVNIELPHVILMVMVTLFGLGVLKLNNN